MLAHWATSLIILVARDYFPVIPGIRTPSLPSPNKHSSGSEYTCMDVAGGLRPPSKKSLFPVQRVADDCRAAAKSFFFPLFFSGKKMMKF